MMSGILRTYVKTLRLRLDQTLDEVARTKKCRPSKTGIVALCRRTIKKRA